MSQPPVLACIHGVDLMRQCIGCAMLALCLARLAAKQERQG